MQCLAFWPRSCFNLCLVAFVLAALLSSFSHAWTIADKRSSSLQQPKKQLYEHPYYDIVIIGAGSSGFAACAAAGLLGHKTALVEINQHLGGDCTNSACVPSKALRSAAAQQGYFSSSLPQEGARQYIKDTVYTVRARENPSEVDKRNSNLDIFLVSHCHFVGSHELQLVESKSNNTKVLHAKNFVIATGASPVVPLKWHDAATKANLPLYTYRSLLSPEGIEMIWDDMLSSSSPINKEDEKSAIKQLLIVGGGATACELGQSLAKLGSRGNRRLLVHLVAPEILPLEDVHLRSSALRLLLYEGVKYHRDRLHAINPDRTVILDSGKDLSGPFEAMLVCVGRSPDASLHSISLDQAGVKWSERGVAVNPHTMQSLSQPHIYAVGDCADAIPLRSRCGAQAAWTGFHAVRNIVVPRLLRLGSRSSIHPCVPSVIYMTPELASVGMTHVECVQKYGLNGFDSMYLPELGSDRADMERSARRTDISFLELRVAKLGGKILGCTSCGPAAAELANSMGMAITNHLTVRDVARSPHSYPSHGYLLHRMALSLALSHLFGLIEACGPVGDQRLHDWEAAGARNAILVRVNGSGDETQMGIGNNVQLLSFLDLHANVTLRNEVEEKLAEEAGHGPNEFQAYKDWMQSKPYSFAGRSS